MKSFISCDGEKKQISVFQEDPILKLFKEALIDFGKPPASCSSDGSPFFKASKKNLKSTVALGEEVYGSRIIKDTVTRTLAEITTFSDQKKKLIVDALQQVV